jgi:hypothetical protein
MKPICPLMLALAATLIVGCADKKAAEQKSRDDAAAKAQAEAARKEMETVPKVFRPQYHNKRLEPETKSAAPAASATQPAKKP